MIFHFLDCPKMPDILDDKDSALEATLPSKAMMMRQYLRNSDLDEESGLDFKNKK